MPGDALAAARQAIELRRKATQGHWRAMCEGNQFIDNHKTIVGASRVDGLPRAWNKHYVKSAFELEDVSRFRDEDAAFIAHAANHYAAVAAALIEAAAEIERLKAELAKPRVREEPRKPFVLEGTHMTEPAKPTLVEKMARAHYERAWEGVIGCCEEPWDKLPADYRDRLCDAQRAAFAVVMAEMREPSQGVVNAADCVIRTEYPGAIENAWSAMIAAFEADNASG